MMFAQDTPQSSRDTHIAVGIQALKSGDLDTAERIFDDALRQDSKDVLVLHNLGVIAQVRGEHQLAITRFRQALLLQPDYGPARLLLGSSLLVLRRNTEAIHALKRAVNLMPNEPAARFELARAYEVASDWLDAIQQLQQANRMAPQNEEYSYHLGKALTKLSGWSLQQISRIDPNSARLHQALGQDYAIQEKYDQALAAYQEAARADPKLPDIHLGTALILLHFKRFDEAMAEVERELKLVPESRAALQARSQIEAAKAASAQ
jgi:tetratricopeptide (TPR) repeat protein